MFIIRKIFLYDYIFLSPLYEVNQLIRIICMLLFSTLNQIILESLF
jgi:hypothetical protein